MLQYRNNREGIAALRNYTSRKRTKLFKPPANSDAQSLSSEATGGLTSGQRGCCSEEATARKGLCWREPKGSSLTGDGPLTTALNPCPWGGWGRGLLWGDCLMICQQRTRQTDCWQLPGCNRRVGFYSHPQCSLPGRG